MKRELPLFIVDTSRRHKLGEADFITCTDRDDGFIARVDYVETSAEEVGDDYRIGLANGSVSARIQILRRTGQRPTPTATRSLLKAAMLYYEKITRFSVNVNEPTVDECIRFVDSSIRANYSNLAEASTSERGTIQMSLVIMNAIKNYLKKFKKIVV